MTNFNATRLFTSIVIFLLISHLVDAQTFINPVWTSGSGACEGPSNAIYVINVVNANQSALSSTGWNNLMLSNVPFNPFCGWDPVARFWGCCHQALIPIPGSALSTYVSAPLGFVPITEPVLSYYIPRGSNNIKYCHVIMPYFERYLQADDSCSEGFLKCNSNGTLSIYDANTSPHCTGTAAEFVVVNPTNFTWPAGIPMSYPTEQIGVKSNITTITSFNSTILGNILFEMVVFKDAQQNNVWVTGFPNFMNRFIPFGSPFNTVSTILMIIGSLLCVFNIVIKAIRYRSSNNNVNLIVLMFVDIVILACLIADITVIIFPATTFDLSKILAQVSLILYALPFFLLTLVQISNMAVVFSRSVLFNSKYKVILWYIGYTLLHLGIALPCYFIWSLSTIPLWLFGWFSIAQGFPSIISTVLDFLISLSILVLLIWTPTMKFKFDNRKDTQKLKFWIIAHHVMTTVWNTNKTIVLIIAGFFINTLLVIVCTILQKNSELLGSDQSSFACLNVLNFLFALHSFLLTLFSMNVKHVTENVKNYSLTSQKKGSTSSQGTASKRASAFSASSQTASHGITSQDTMESKVEKLLNDTTSVTGNTTAVRKSSIMQETTVNMN